MKRIVSLAMAFILAASLFPASVLAANEYANHWAEGYITLLVNKGIVTGDRHGNIHPDNNITRAEFVALTVRTFELAEVADTNFPDVVPGRWYYPYFAIARQAGIVQGGSGGNANPAVNITRAEVAVILARTLNITADIAATAFTDNSDIPHWAMDSVAAMTERGLITGFPNGTFMPQRSLTRAEGFALIARIINMGLADAELYEVAEEDYPGQDEYDEEDDQATPTVPPQTPPVDDEEQPPAGGGTQPPGDGGGNTGGGSATGMLEDGSGDFQTNMLNAATFRGVTDEAVVQAATSIGGIAIRRGPVSRAFTIHLPISTESELRAMAAFLMDNYPHLFEDVRLESHSVGHNNGFAYSQTQGGEEATYFRTFNAATEPPTNESSNFWTSVNSWNLRAIYAAYAWALLYDNEVAQVTKIGVADGAFMYDHEDLVTGDSGQYRPNIINLPADAIEFPYAVNATEEEKIAVERNRFMHGTHVMGTIGAVHDNQIGLAGAMDISRDNLYGRDVFTTTGRYANGVLGGRSRNLDLLDTFESLVTSGVQVINYSVGGTTDSTNPDFAREMQDLLYAGYDFLIVHSAGNDTTNARRNNVWAHVPDDAVCHNNIPLRDRIITVGAVRTNDMITPQSFYMADFTNYGPRVDVVAPGVDIYSTVRGVTPADEAQGIYEDVFFSSYDTFRGTSMAAPHVAALAAMVWDANPNLTGAEVKQIIVASARGSSIMNNRVVTEHRNDNVPDDRPDPISTAYENATYYLIDARNAVQMALGYLPFQIRGAVASAMPPMWGENPDIFFTLRCVDWNVLWTGYFQDRASFSISAALYVGQDYVFTEMSRHQTVILETRADGYPTQFIEIRIIPNAITHRAVLITNNDITSDFRDPVLLDYVLWRLGRPAGSRILAYDVYRITELTLFSWEHEISEEMGSIDMDDAWPFEYLYFYAVKTYEYDYCCCDYYFYWWPNINTRVTSLAGIEHFISLEHLVFAGGQGNINLSNNRALQTLEIFFAGNITGINVTNSLQLETLRVEDIYPMSNIDLSRNLQLQDLTLFSWQGNFAVPDVSNHKQLQTLFIASQQLSTLDTSNNTELQVLHLEAPRLTNLDLSNNRELRELYLWTAPQLANLDLSNNRELQDIYIGSGGLTELDLSNNSELERLSVHNSPLTNINLLHNRNLQHLNISHSQLEYVNLSGNRLLESLSLNSNPLTRVNLSSNRYLRYVNLSDTLISSIVGLSTALELQTLWISNGQLTSIDLSNNTQLHLLWLSNNQLTGINIPNSAELILLNLDNNQLSSLDVTNNRNLISIIAANNNLGGLDVSDLSNLSSLDVRGNLMTSPEDIIGWRYTMLRAPDSISFRFSPQRPIGVSIEELFYADYCTEYADYEIACPDYKIICPDYDEDSELEDTFAG